MPHRHLQVAVLGLGPFGLTISQALHESGHEVLAVDPRSEVTQSAQDDGLATHVVQADPESLQALRELEIWRFDVVVVARGSDVEASLATVLNLLELNVHTIIAKAAHARHAKLLERVGGDRVRVVYPERDMGLRVVHQVMGQDIMEAVWVDPHHSFAERPLKPELQGKTVAEARMRSEYGLVLVAIRRGGNLLIAPGSDTRLEAGDRLVLLGRNDRFQSLD